MSKVNVLTLPLSICTLLFCLSWGLKTIDLNRAADEQLNVTLDQLNSIIKSDAPQNVKDLASLTIALKSYQRDLKKYPASTFDTAQKAYVFDSFKSVESESWISGLTDYYHSPLPRTYASHAPTEPAFIYRSNKAYFLLIVRDAKDCAWVANNHTNLLYNRCPFFGVWVKSAPLH